MGIDFIPQNPLEQAIYDRNREMLIHAVAEGEVLTTLAPASNLGDECFPDEVIFAVLFIAATGKQVKTMTNGWFWGYLHAGERLRKLTEETLAPLPQEPSPLERALIKAIVYRENEEIIRLIEQENIKFHGFAVELLNLLPELSKAAILTLLRDGLSAKLKAIIFGIFLNETRKSERLPDLSYNDRIKYTNLMIRILAGNHISADEPWYPEDSGTDSDFRKILS